MHEGRSVAFGLCLVPLRRFERPPEQLLRLSPLPLGYKGALARIMEIRFQLTPGLPQPGRVRFTSTPPSSKALASRASGTPDRIRTCTLMLLRHLPHANWATRVYASEPICDWQRIAPIVGPAPTVTPFTEGAINYIWLMGRVVRKTGFEPVTFAL